MDIPVVENPRKRKRARSRRRTPARGAHGRFRKSRTAKRRRRRNPSSLATVLGNPRRRRSPSTRRRRSGLLGEVGGLFDLESAGLVTAGIVSQRYLPGLVAQQLNVKLDGVTGYLVRAGTGLALGFLVKRFAGARYARLIVTGAMASLLTDVFDERVAPAIGLSKMAGYYNAPSGRVTSAGFPEWGRVAAPGAIPGVQVRRSRVRDRSRTRV